MPRRTRLTEDTDVGEDVVDPLHPNRRAGSGEANHTVADSNVYNGPVDLDELFMASHLEAQRAADDGSLFSDDDEDETQRLVGKEQKYFNNPHKRVSFSTCFGNFLESGKP